MAEMEIKVALFGLILCFLGFAIFLYGTSNMTGATMVSDSFLVVVAVFLGIAGFLVFVAGAFSRDSMFS